MPNAMLARPAVKPRAISVRRPDLVDSRDALPKYFVADDLVRSHIVAMLGRTSIPTTTTPRPCWRAGAASWAT